MTKEELIALANNAIARWDKVILKTEENFPVVQVHAERLADEIEIHPYVIGKYIGTTVKGNYVYNIPAHAILEYLSGE